MGGEGCGDSHHHREEVEELDTWIETRVDRLRSDFLQAIDGGEKEQARQHVEDFESSLAQRLSSIHETVMNEATAMLANGQAEDFATPSVDLDLWVTRKVDQLRIDYFEALQAEDKDEAHQHVTLFEKSLGRRLSAIQQEISGETTTMLDDELKVRRESMHA